MSDVPALVIKVVDENLWQKFRSPAGDEEYKSFEDFVTKSIPSGLGATVSLLQNLCRDDTAALEAIDRAMQRPNGGDRRSEDFSVNNVNTERPMGNSESAALRRLRKDRPDLLAEVLDNKLSANAAAIKAGFRPKTFTIRADRPESIVATLRRQLSPDVYADVQTLFVKDS